MVEICSLSSKHTRRLKFDISVYFNQTKTNLKKKIWTPPAPRFKILSPNLFFTSKVNPKLNTIAYRLVAFYFHLIHTPYFVLGLLVSFLPSNSNSKSVSSPVPMESLRKSNSNVILPNSNNNLCIHNLELCIIIVFHHQLPPLLFQSDPCRHRQHPWIKASCAGRRDIMLTSGLRKLELKCSIKVGSSKILEDSSVQTFSE